VCGRPTAPAAADSCRWISGSPLRPLFLAPGLGTGVALGRAVGSRGTGRHRRLATRSSHQRHAVRDAAALLDDHVGKLGRFDLGAVAPLDEVHHGERGALCHGAGALPVAEAPQRAGGLQAPPRAPVRLVPCRLDDPVLRPGELAEADVVFLPAAGGLPRHRLLLAVPRAPAHQGRNKNQCCDWKPGRWEKQSPLFMA